MCWSRYGKAMCVWGGGLAADAAVDAAHTARLPPVLLALLSNPACEACSRCAHDDARSRAAPPSQHCRHPHGNPRHRHAAHCCRCDTAWYDVCVQIIYVSLDPYIRGRLGGPGNPAAMPPYTMGDVIGNYAAGGCHAGHDVT